MRVEWEGFFSWWGRRYRAGQLLYCTSSDELELTYRNIDTPDTLLYERCCTPGCETLFNLCRGTQNEANC